MHMKMVISERIVTQVGNAVLLVHKAADLALYSY